MWVSPARTSNETSSSARTPGNCLEMPRSSNSGAVEETFIACRVSRCRPLGPLDVIVRESGRSSSPRRLALTTALRQTRSRLDPPLSRGMTLGSDGSCRELIPPRPEHSLIAARLRRDALIDELLQALTLVGLGRVEIALGVRRDAVHAVELPRLASAVAERRELLERVAQDHAHALVLAVGQEHEALLRILGERDVPYRAGAARVPGIERLLDELALGLEHLHAVVLPIAHVDEAVVRPLDAVHGVAELGGRLRLRIV